MKGTHKIGCLLIFELLTALLYLAWLSPSVARYHLEAQTAIPIYLFVIDLIAAVVVVLWHVIAHKSLAERRYTIYSLFTLLLWSAVLLCIGLYTVCPLCGAYWFYDWIAQI